MDPVSSTIAAARLCWHTYELIEGIKNAPDAIDRLSTDLYGFYGVLGTIESTLKTLSAGPDTNPLAVQTIANIQYYVDKSVTLFQTVNVTIQPYVNSRSVWRAWKWESLKKYDVAALQSSLMDYKASLTIACTSLNVINSAQTIEVVKHLHKDVRRIQQHNDNKDRQELFEHYQSAPLIEADEIPNPLDSHYNVAMERFLSRNESVTSSMSRSSYNPSMMLSDAASERTVIMEEDESEEARPRQLEVVNNPIPNLHTLMEDKLHIMAKDMDQLSDSGTARQTKDGEGTSRQTTPGQRAADNTVTLEVAQLTLDDSTPSDQVQTENRKTKPRATLRRSLYHRPNFLNRSVTAAPVLESTTDTSVEFPEAKRSTSAQQLSTGLPTIADCSNSEAHHTISRNTQSAPDPLRDLEPSPGVHVSNTWPVVRPKQPTIAKRSTDPSPPTSPDTEIPSDPLGSPADPSRLNADPRSHCYQCNGAMRKGRAYEIDGHLYHPECFRCGTCRKFLDRDTPYHLIGDDTLVCGTCQAAYFRVFR